MGREVRRVPPNWQHPKDDKGRYVALSDGYNKRLAEWDEGCRQWQNGMMEDYSKSSTAWKQRSDDTASEITYEEWTGRRPDHRKFMPDWPADQRTHFQMYENTSEGTPISPVCATPEELARWLADNDASAFSDMTATYEQWLSTIGAGGAVSMVFGGGRGMRSGVAAMAENDR